MNAKIISCLFVAIGAMTRVDDPTLGAVVIARHMLAEARAQALEAA